MKLVLGYSSKIELIRFCDHYFLGGPATTQTSIEEFGNHKDPSYYTENLDQEVEDRLGVLKVVNCDW